MNDNTSLLAILRSDPEYAKQLQKRIAEVKLDKQNLLSAAQEVEKLHLEEIEEGTRKRALLLSEGKAKGIEKEEDIMKDYGRFLPTRKTPILNLLYFLLKEDTSKQWREELREEFFKKFGHEYDGLGRVALEEKYGQEEHLEPVNEEVEDPPELMEFIYGNVTTSQFQKIKKLKALSRSSNEHEAFMAYKACLLLCNKFNLEFDKIPCNIK